MLTSWRAFLARPPVRLASLVFGLLVIVAMGAFAFHTETRGAEMRNWVIHSYTVHDKLSQLEIELAQARSNAFAYLELQSPSDAEAVRAHAQRALQASGKLQELTADHPRQQGQIRSAESLMREYFAKLERCVQPESCGADGSIERREVLEDASLDRDRIHALVSDVRSREEALLQSRLQAWDQLFQRNIIIFALAFAAAIVLLANNFRLQNAEIAKSKELEHVQRDKAESFRALSARILELQDVERRKIARELHDSVGQYLAALKMNLSQMVSGKKRLDDASSLNDTIAMADLAIAEVRTISHLLHPPLLDELGFQSAASWYIEQFAKRSGTKVNLAFDDVSDRLPKESELALFRVLQESLTNVHRHTKARQVDVRLVCADGMIVLTVHDDGQGIAPAVLARLRAGSGAGIGLAGMGERLSDLGGTLEVESPGVGTRIRATLPAAESRQASNEAAMSSST